MQPIPLTVGDCRGLVKTLVCGMKTITWGVGSCKVPGTTVDFCESVCVCVCMSHVCVYVCLCVLRPPLLPPSASNQELFFPHETEQFVRLFRHGVVALDIYRVTNLSNGNHVLRNAKSAQLTSHVTIM